MKKIFTLLSLLVLLIQATYSQFKFVPAGTGFAYSSSASISFVGYAASGGGVVLRATAKPSNDLKAISFSNVSFNNASNDYQSLTFTTTSGNVELTSLSWILRDAAVLVNSESESKLYRNVNLLSSPKLTEDSIKYPTEKYWYIEISNALKGTKSGETLLLVDLLQTDYLFYSDSCGLRDVYRYNQAMVKKPQQIKDSIDHYFITKIYTSVLKIDSIKKSSSSDLIKQTLINKIENKITKDTSDYFTASKNIKEKYNYSNWTYNDENTDFIFKINQNKKISITGRPIFTYTYRKTESSDDYFDYKYSTVINEYLTNYFSKNYYLIENLKRETFQNAVEFSRIAAFYRYLKNNQSSTWSKIYAYYSLIPKKNGNTPRLIEK